MIIEQFFPDEYELSAAAIDYERLRDEGVRGIIFDIDNTLVPHDAPADEGAIALFKKLHDLGFKCLLLSNNDRERVKTFADKVIYTDFINNAGKPGREGYEKALKRMGTGVNDTVFVGDQLFTDIFGARRTGIRSILVAKVNNREKFHIKLKRILEKPILFVYFKGRANGNKP